MRRLPPDPLGLDHKCRIAAMGMAADAGDAGGAGVAPAGPSKAEDRTRRVDARLAQDVIAESAGGAE